MEEFQCCYWGDFFPKIPMHKVQLYCMKPACRRAKKAIWKRKKMREDPEYKSNHKASNKKWVEANPGYWKAYRKNNPEKGERNRILQAVCNRSKSIYPHRLGPFKKYQTEYMIIKFFIDIYVCVQL